MILCQRYIKNIVFYKLVTCCKQDLGFLKLINALTANQTCFILNRYCMHISFVQKLKLIRQYKVDISDYIKYYANSKNLNLDFKFEELLKCVSHRYIFINYIMQKTNIDTFMRLLPLVKKRQDIFHLYCCRFAFRLSDLVVFEKLKYNIIETDCLEQQDFSLIPLECLKYLYLKGFDFKSFAPLIMRDINFNSDAWNKFAQIGFIKLPGNSDKFQIQHVIGLPWCKNRKVVYAVWILDHSIFKLNKFLKVLIASYLI